jgi:hypothetical protein
MFDPPMLSLAAAILASALSPVAGGEVLARGDWAPHDTVITMIYGGCESRCPSFEVVIFGDGTVIVEGRAYLRHPILATSQIPAFAVKKLVERFTAIDYFNLPDHFGYRGKGCTSFGTGEPRNITTTIVSGGRGRSLTHDRACQGVIPDQLTALENEINLTANTAKWLKPARR